LNCPCFKLLRIDSFRVSATMWGVAAKGSWSLKSVLVAYRESMIDEKGLRLLRRPFLVSKEEVGLKSVWPPLVRGCWGERSIHSSQCIHP
jgi:hypothetical protein